MRIGLLRVTKHIRTKEINVGKMLVFFFMRYEIWNLKPLRFQKDNLVVFGDTFFLLS